MRAAFLSLLVQPPFFGRGFPGPGGAPASPCLAAVALLVLRAHQVIEMATFSRFRTLQGAAR